MTDRDLIDSVSATYGVPVLAMTGTLTAPVATAPADSTQLVVSSKRLATLARSAIAESVRLDRIEAPARAASQREREAGDASAARDKTRATNKGAFRP